MEKWANVVYSQGSEILFVNVPCIIDRSKLLAESHCLLINFLRKEPIYLFKLSIIRIEQDAIRWKPIEVTDDRTTTAWTEPGANLNLSPC